MLFFRLFWTSSIQNLHTPALVFPPQVLLLFSNPSSLSVHSLLCTPSSFSPPFFDPCFLRILLFLSSLTYLIPFPEVGCPAIEKAIKYPVFFLVLLPFCQNVTQHPAQAARKA